MSEATVNSGSGQCAVNRDEMPKAEQRALLLRVHYRLMDNPRFWCDKALTEWSKMLCLKASDLREEMEREETA